MALVLDNLKRSLTMLEKALDRLTRLNYFDPKQRPEIFCLIEDTIDKIRQWLKTYTIIDCLKKFYAPLSLFISDLGRLTSQLWDTCKPKPGKKKIKKSRKIQEQDKIMRSIGSMMKNIKEYLKNSKSNDSIFGIAFDEGAEMAIYYDVIQAFKKKLKISFPGGEKKLIFSHIKIKTHTHPLYPTKRDFVLKL